MKDEKSIQHNFNWNSKAGFFASEEHEEQEITLGPDLSYPLLSKPTSEEELKMRRQKLREMPTRKAA